MRWKAPQNNLYYLLAKPGHECLIQLGTFAPYLHGKSGREVPGVHPQHFWENFSFMAQSGIHVLRFLGTTANRTIKKHPLPVLLGDTSQIRG